MGPPPGSPHGAPLQIVTVTGGEIEVDLLPDLGARLHRLRAFGHDLLRTPDDLSAHVRDPFRWGAYVMAPWCNRIAASPVVVEGQRLALLPNFEDGTAIHGQVHSAPWQDEAAGTFAVRGGGDAWPWPYECRLGVAAERSVLTIDLALANLAPTPMPAGIGWHPWFRGPLEVQIDAERAIASNIDPDAPIEAVAGPLDLRSLGPMPPDLDAAWADPGDPAVELKWPDLGVAATLRAHSEGGLWIVAASPAALEAVAVEPQNHAPYGLARLLRGDAGGMQLLAAGATTRLVIELAFSRR